MNRSVLITQVANVFGTLLFQHLGDLKMAAIVAVNAANTSDGHPETYASHDWCDANVFMEAAMLAVAPGYEGFNANNQDAVTLCNEAWGLAKRHGFKHIDIPNG
jgi:hypothetical protein